MSKTEGQGGGVKEIVRNRRARHDYQVLDRFEAGVELRGTEVKSLRAGRISLKDSYADVEAGEIFLVGAHITPYEQGNINNHAPERPRRLLMHKHEIRRLGAQIAEKGLTLVPLRLYFKRGRVKIELGLCRGKHTVDKRQTIRERDLDREAEREMRNRRK